MDLQKRAVVPQQEQPSSGQRQAMEGHDLEFQPSKLGENKIRLFDTPSPSK